MRVELPWILHLFYFAIFVNGVPSPQSLNSDLSIYLHNDLYGNSSSRTEAVIVLSAPQTLEHAQASCAALGESLWNPPPDAEEFLGYANFLTPDHYWAANSSNATCSSGACDVKLPTLCTQSAPSSNQNYSDTSSRWQTSVTSGSQIITGYRDKYSFRFEGIRYAPQPERFTYSTLFEGTGNVSALSFGSECAQSGNVGTEDCLFLNIWTSSLPSNATNPSTLKPVVFWIHGGAFIGGTGSDPTFDGGNMASRGDVVVVTINYRLGTLGFLALEDGVTNGNFGLADQIVALEWIREHARDFGGDSEQITIFGQSAGAASVRALLASPKARGKFAAAIPMSSLAGYNYATTYSQYYTIPEEVAVAAVPILNATGCLNATSQVGCLRAVDPFVLANLSSVSSSAVARYLVVDGTYLTSNELELTGPGSAADVPIMMGFMRDDGAAFISYPSTTNVSAALTADSFNTSDILASGLFPTPSGPNATLDVFNVTAHVATDVEFRCLDQSTAYVGLENGVWQEGSLYFYEFNRSYQIHGFDPNAPVCDAPITPDFPTGDPDQEYFKCHSGELYYVFGNLYRLAVPPRDDLDIPFSQFILDTWTSFARTYNPNPDPEYLRARGYTNTSMRLESQGLWNPVSVQDPSLRELQWDAVQLGFGEESQCEVLGLPLDFYETGATIPGTGFGK